MKKSSVILLILFIVSGVFYYELTKEPTEVLTGKITRVIDGDTIEINNDYRVRLKGINTPETSMWNSEESTKFLKKYENKTVEIISFGTDKYDRILGYLFYEDENLNEKILKNGLASIYYYEEDRYYRKMSKAEEFARNNEIGIWKKSPEAHCVEIIEFSYIEPEILNLKNSCNLELKVIIKDDATHIYKETLLPGIFEMNTSHIWNNEGDTIYIWDKKGLLIFYRY